MNTKMLMAALAAGVTAFLLGWLLFGMALSGFYEANMIHYEGLMKGEDEMNLGLIFLGNLMLGILLAWMCMRMGVTGAVGGFMVGGITGLLVYASVDFMFLAMMNMFANSTAVVVDILANAVWAAATGAVAGLVLGLGNKPASA